MKEDLALRESISIHTKVNQWDYLEPEPVEDLEGADDGEAGEEAHHAAHPGDLVREGHAGTFSDLASKIQV